MAEKMHESGKSNSRMDLLVNQLRSQLKDFTVRDKQGQPIGEIKDVHLAPNRQLNLVIAQANAPQNLRLLSSKLIQKAIPQTRSVFVDLNPGGLEQLPYYVSPESLIQELAALAEPQTEQEQLERSASQTPLAAKVEPETLERSTLTSQTPKVTAAEVETSDPPTFHAPEVENQTLTPPITEVTAEEIIRLLEEQLVVDRTRRKIGEVIVRKVVETRLVEVPVRFEKLIVEQISPEHKQLAEVDLGQGEITGVELSEVAELEGRPTIQGEFTSPEAASQVLAAIAHQSAHGCAKVRVEIVLEDAAQRPIYQEWFDRGSAQSPSELDRR